MTTDKEFTAIGWREFTAALDRHDPRAAQENMEIYLTDACDFATASSRLAKWCRENNWATISTVSA